MAVINMKAVNWFQFDVPTSYAEIESLQKTIFNNKLAQASLSDVVIACQHFPVLTLGRRTKAEHVHHSRRYLWNQGVEVHEIVRGGSVTAHEPGQLVFYPLLNLKNYGLDGVQYLAKLGEWMIRVCHDLGMRVSLSPVASVLHPEGTHLTGVWVGIQKVASIGIRIQNSITMHGVALNINNDCSTFQYIAPCGIEGLKVSSAQQVTGITYDLYKVMKMAEEHFKKLFGVSTECIYESVPVEGTESGVVYGQETS